MAKKIPTLPYTATNLGPEPFQWVYAYGHSLHRLCLTEWKTHHTSKEDTDLFLRVCIKMTISILNCTLLRRNQMSVNEPLQLTITQPDMWNSIGCVRSFEWTLLSNTVSPPSPNWTHLLGVLPKPLWIIIGESWTTLPFFHSVIALGVGN